MKELLTEDGLYERQKQDMIAEKQALTNISDNSPIMIVDDDQTNVLSLQRKILPHDILSLTLKEASMKTRQNGALRVRQDVIICASLIDRVPNLAGLCRTCEIFAATSLVVPDKGIVHDENFKNIAVTAYEWVPIEEVKEKDLLQWLREKKGHGYSIAGLEQASNSQNLVDKVLPPKLVILLGREKMGIPTYLLNEIDHVIEIPQLGLIRSLNVHVSGAILLWEYTKQRMLEEKGKLKK